MVFFGSCTKSSAERKAAPASMLSSVLSSPLLAFGTSTANLVAASQEPPPHHHHHHHHPRSSQEMDEKDVETWREGPPGNSRDAVLPLKRSGLEGAKLK